MIDVARHARRRRANRAKMAIAFPEVYAHILGRVIARHALMKIIAMNAFLVSGLLMVRAIHVRHIAPNAMIRDAFYVMKGFIYPKVHVFDARTRALHVHLPLIVFHATKGFICQTVQRVARARRAQMDALFAHHRHFVFRVLKGII